MAEPKAQKKRRRGALRAPLTFIIVCAALLFGMSVFFRVSSIEVTGNSYYTEEEIILASGIEEGDNLFFLNKSSAAARMYSKLPYLTDVSITRVLPNKLVIDIIESAAIAYVTSESGLWAIDSSCKLLSTIEQSEASSLIEIRSLTPIAPETGEVIAPGDAESPKVAYLADILAAIEDNNMQGDIEWIDMSDISNPSFYYLGRFTVRLGYDEELDYKFLKLLAAVNELAAGDRGTLDLSIDKRVHLTYD